MKTFTPNDHMYSKLEQTFDITYSRTPKTTLNITRELKFINIAENHLEAVLVSLFLEEFAM